MLNDSIIYELPHSNRIVVIGDLHGDLKRLTSILIDAKIFNDTLEWIAQPPSTIVVQVGDQVDSLKRDANIEDWEKLPDTEILYFTQSLDSIAKANGGRFISLIGNHELMNIIGNFSYVSPNSLGNPDDRLKQYKPTGTLSNILAMRPLILKVGSLLFSHSFIRKHHLDILDAAKKPVSYVNNLWHQFMSSGRISIDDKDIFDKIILDPTDGILWTRSLDNDDKISEIKQILNIEYAFVGHNSVEKIQLINNFVFLVDTGISRAFGTKSYQYVDIQDNNISVKTIAYF